jgi:heparanase
VPGGVVLLVINNDPQDSHELTLAGPASRFTLDAEALQGTAVRLNGMTLDADAVDRFPSVAGMETGSGPVNFAPATISFVAIPDAKNRNCG